MNKGENCVYLVIDCTDDLLLPLGCFDTLADISRRFLIPYATVYAAFIRGSVIKRYKFSIELVDFVSARCSK